MSIFVTWRSLARIWFAVFLTLAILLIFSTSDLWAQPTETGTTPPQGALIVRDRTGKPISLTPFYSLVRSDSQALIGRERELSQMNSTAPNQAILLVGDRSTGRGAIVRKFAAGQNVYALNIQTFLDQVDPSMRAEVLKSIMIHVSKIPNTWLWIEDVELLTFDARSADVFSTLAEGIGVGRKLILTVLPETLGKLQANNLALSGRFRKVEMKSISQQAILQALREVVPQIEAETGVQVPEDAVLEEARVRFEYMASRPLENLGVFIRQAALVPDQTLLNNISKVEAEIAFNSLWIREMKKEGGFDDVIVEVQGEIAKLQTEESELKVKYATLAGQSSSDSQIQSLKDRLTAIRTELSKLTSWYNPWEMHQKYLLQSELRQKTEELAALENAPKASRSARTTVISPKDIDRQAQDYLRVSSVNRASDPIQVENDILKLDREIYGNDHIIAALAKAIPGAISARQDELRKAAADPFSRAIESSVKDARTLPPIIAALLGGESGTGKTELAMQLKQILGMEILKIVMSDYQDKSKLTRLIGATATFVGYGDRTTLTDPVLENPYQIILFDEIEKAPPEFVKMLLGVLDDGLMVDGRARNVLFSNTMIFMTTNAGKSYMGWSEARLRMEYFEPKIQQGLLKEETIKSRTLDQLKVEVIKFELEHVYGWPSETINRIIAHIYAFNSHTVTSITKVFHKFLRSGLQGLETTWRDRVGGKQNVKIVLSDEAVWQMIDKVEIPRGGRSAKAVYMSSVYGEIDRKVKFPEAGKNILVVDSIGVDAGNPQFTYTFHTQEEFDQVILLDNTQSRQAEIEQRLAREGEGSVDRRLTVDMLGMSEKYIIRDVVAKALRRVK